MRSHVFIFSYQARFSSREFDRFDVWMYTVFIETEEERMPNNANVFFVEDSKEFRRAVKRLLEDRGHTVVLEAGSLKEALQKVEEAKEKGVNIAIIDGDLGTGSDDGQKVAEELRRAIPGIKIISCSGAVTPITWGDENPGKEGVIKIPGIITQF